MIDAIGISCANIEESIKFYQLFELSFIEYGQGHFEARMGGGQRLMLDSYELLQSINNNWKKPSGRGAITLCFKQVTPASVDKLYNKVIESGFRSEVEPWDAPWGQRYASVLDPDDNQVDIFAPIVAN